MQLLLVRHAIAADRFEFARSGRDDDERPLTERGRARMRRAVAGLGTVLSSLDLLAASPLVRAAQTAELLAEGYRQAVLETLPCLAPGGERAGVVDWLAERRPGSAAVVGHEPDLSELAAWLLTGRPAPFIEFKKGAACLLEFSGEPEAGLARLCWHLAPRQLRALAGGTE